METKEDFILTFEGICQLIEKLAPSNCTWKMSCLGRCQLPSFQSQAVGRISRVCLITCPKCGTSESSCHLMSTSLKVSGNDIGFSVHKIRNLLELGANRIICCFKTYLKANEF